MANEKLSQDQSKKDDQENKKSSPVLIFEKVEPVERPIKKRKLNEFEQPLNPLVPKKE